MEWQLHNDTHMKRHTSIIERHTQIAKHWVEIVKKYPANSPEIEAEISVLWKKLGNLFEESKEVYLDFANDTDILVKLLDELKKEFEKLSDGKN